ncbi:MAG: helix-turn-helix domain-containing protein [Bacteroidetes bacterium]|jgi:transcriptional regulator with XRE-family HTH domain|nr:helix-turn-helix domain-containing protein [Bacteroidota bacterium]
MDSYLIGIGKKIRALRKEKNLYASEIAKRANVSNGLISRIENGRTIPSVPVLFSIIEALEIEPSYFFHDIGPNGVFKYVVIRHDEHQPVEKEVEATGYTYDFIYSKQLNGIGTEFVLLTLQPDCRREPVETDAFEFKYMLSGECLYWIDGETVELKKGDAIFFDGRLPHVPKNPNPEPAVMLVCYLYTE